LAGFGRTTTVRLKADTTYKSDTLEPSVSTRPAILIRATCPFLRNSKKPSDAEPLIDLGPVWPFRR